MKAYALICSLLLFTPTTVTAFQSIDNQSVKRALEEDQASRSEENFQQGKFPKFADEMNRRLLVFTALSRGELVAANDFYHAAVILQHTNLEHVGDTLRSMGTENHLLAHFLAKFYIVTYICKYIELYIGDANDKSTCRRRYSTSI
ncbi:hypothetical protein SAMN02927930_01030 [Pseudidiomarina indica]|uniref:Uncharacterized protein n=1 Tax=Pseudidiomarina indica TaxID=1159017 RepID=A0A1G6C021_9GAMM|nr:hypothetical protein SAMN02927930_01030 [Pseudidiomarina indica]